MSRNKIGSGTDTFVQALKEYHIELKYLNLEEYEQHFLLLLKNACWRRHSPITVLICSCQIPPSSMKDIFNAIASNKKISTKIEYLNVSGNRFDEETSSALGSWGLKVYHDPTEITLALHSGLAHSSHSERLGRQKRRASSLASCKH